MCPFSCILNFIVEYYILKIRPERGGASRKTRPVSCGPVLSVRRHTAVRNVILAVQNSNYEPFLKI